LTAGRGARSRSNCRSSPFYRGEFGVTGAFVGVSVKLTGKGAEAVYEFELSPSEKEAFTKSVAANTELMNIARGFLG